MLKVDMSGMYVMLLLGGNLGDVRGALNSAIESLRERVGELCWFSRVHQSESWGYSSENSYVNQLTILNTPLSALEVLNIIETIEQDLGREPKDSENWRSPQRMYSDRTMDIDILYLFDAEGFISFSDERLQVPHPRIEEREFVQSLLSEVDFEPYVRVLS